MIVAADAQAVVIHEQDPHPPAALLPAAPEPHVAGDERLARGTAAGRVEDAPEGPDLPQEIQVDAVGSGAVRR